MSAEGSDSIGYATFEFENDSQEDVFAVKMVRDCVGAQLNPILHSFTRDTPDGLEVAPSITDVVRALHTFYEESGERYEVVISPSAVSLRKESTNEDFYFVSQEGIAGLLPEDNPGREELASAMMNLGEIIKQTQVLRTQIDAAARKSVADCKHHLSMCRRFVDSTQSQFDHVRRFIEQGLSKLS